MEWQNKCTFVRAFSLLRCECVGRAGAEATFIPRMLCAAATLTKWGIYFANAPGVSCCHKFLTQFVYHFAHGWHISTRFIYLSYLLICFAPDSKVELESDQSANEYVSQFQMNNLNMAICWLCQLLLSLFAINRLPIAAQNTHTNLNHLFDRANLTTI